MPALPWVEEGDRNADESLRTELQMGESGHPVHDAARGWEPGRSLTGSAERVYCLGQGRGKLAGSAGRGIEAHNVGYGILACTRHSTEAWGLGWGVLHGQRVFREAV